MGSTSERLQTQRLHCSLLEYNFFPFSHICYHEVASINLGLFVSPVSIYWQQIKMLRYGNLLVLLHSNVPESTKCVDAKRTMFVRLLLSGYKHEMWVIVTAR